MCEEKKTRLGEKLLPLSVPHLAGAEWEYVKECLDTGWVSSVGSYVGRFEKKMAERLGAPHAVAVSSGTAALHLSLLAAGIGPGDEVLVPTLTFVAPANAVRYCGATPILVDCDPATLCLDVARCIEFLESRCEPGKDGGALDRKTGRRVKAVLPVHVFGHPADMEPLMLAAGRFGLAVIEDATESLGSTYEGRYAGAIGDLGCLSFNGNKIITTGGGGMVLSGNKAWAERVRHLSTQAKSDPFEYEHDEIGYNYRLTNVLSAIGLAQLEQLDRFVEIKRRNAALYAELLRRVKPVRMFWEADEVRSNFWFYTLSVPAEHRRPLMRYLLTRSIEVRPVWRLLHTLPMYRDCELLGGSAALQAYETCFNVPCSVDLTEEDVHRVCGLIRDYFRSEGGQ
jgi:perosamine synthetase